MPTSARRRLLLCALALQLVLGALVLSSSAGAAGSDVRITHQGVARAYRLYVPSTIPAGGPASLVLVLHGLSGTPSGMQSVTGLDHVAHANRFVVAYPYGLDRSWNAGTCCGTSSRRKVDDVGFLAAVIERIRSERRIDRVFVTGFSNGGMMAMRLACSRPDLVTAVAAVQATLVHGCAPKRPVHTMLVNGRLDAVVPYSGYRYHPTLRSPLAPVSVTVGTWERLNACSGLPEVSARGRVSIRVYARCVGGSSVRLVALAKTGHTWPKAGSDGYAASQEIWRFFASVQQAVNVPTRQALLTTQTTAARTAADSRTYVVGTVSGRFDVVIQAPVTVDVLEGGVWKPVGKGTTDLDGGFRVAVPVPSDATLLVRYAGSGLPSGTVAA